MDFTIVNKPIMDTADKIQREITDKFQSAGNTFVSSFENAIKDMQGEAKEALSDFFKKSYKDLVSSKENGIPAMVKGLGELLEVNRKQFAQTDHNIALKIKEANKG